MIDLYSWSTPNGRKVSIMLEELGVPYRAFPIDITKDEQFDPEFLAIAPNNRIPAIVDRENDMTLMESGAILLYLAKKHERFLPTGDEEWRAVEWLMWQMGGLGPMLGQANHFLKFNPGRSDYAETRYGAESARLYGVLDKRLIGRDFIAGTGRGIYSLADMACWPWTCRHDWHGIDLTKFPNLLSWYRRIAERPAVTAGYNVPIDTGPIPVP